ncbi:zf-CCHC domain-containing protein [Tanacetum coccineum]|uniref:Zf-CCHC domain-containing protein n=1 Tax=Tanacetum coccineum TaxID=301880 RepID=A0ABQ5BAN4_9ASTR
MTHAFPHFTVPIGAAAGVGHSAAALIQAGPHPWAIENFMLVAKYPSVQILAQDDLFTSGVIKSATDFHTAASSQLSSGKAIEYRINPDYSSKNHVRKFFRALPLKWRAKVTAIEEAKYLATLSLDKLIGNLKVYEMILDNDGVASKTTKENVMSLALKAKVTREQTSDDSDSQGGNDEDIDEEEEAKVFNLMARNFRKFFHKGNLFGRGNLFGNGVNQFGKGRGNSFGTKVVKARNKRACYNCGVDGHFASECRKTMENKNFFRRSLER